MVSTAFRAGTAADAIDAVIPQRVASPASGEELSQILADASRDRQLTVLRGGGSKIEWGRVPDRIDLVIGTENLTQLIAHRYGDMTVTAQAGMPLSVLNHRLAEHGQYLPVESAFERATVGGIIATNDSGPLRHRFGTPRDLLIGVTLAMADGRLVKAGGTVVKNVAGYDLGKLVSGSHGTLAAIVDATFKLLPIPLASTTLVATYGDEEALARDVTVLRGSQVELTSCDVRRSHEGQWTLLMRMASSQAATKAQASEVWKLLSVRSAAVMGEEEQGLWAGQIRAPWSEGGTTLRLSWSPANLPAVVESIDNLSSRGCRMAAFVGRTMGAGVVMLDGNERATSGAIAGLRESKHLGHVVILRAGRGIKMRTDVWGPDSGGIEVARALKRMFDPQGILNAGRGPI